MSEFKAKTEVKGGSDRSFGIVFAVVFLVVALLPLWDGGAPRLWALAIALVLLAIAFIRPVLLAVPNRIWFKFGMLLGRIVSPIVMGAMFFVVVTPIALLMRAAGKDPLRLKKADEADSYWMARGDARDHMQSMRNQF